MTWAPDYITAATLKSYLRIGDTADDVFIALWVTTVSRNVDDFCRRQFGKVAATETREFPSQWDRRASLYTVDIDDLMNDDITVLDPDGVEVTDYTLLPVNADKKGRPWERLTTATAGSLTIDGVWGWSAVPSAVSTGCLIQGARLAARRDSPFGIAGSPSEGSEIRLLAALDPDFKTALRPFQRDWWAA